MHQEASYSQPVSPGQDGAPGIQEALLLEGRLENQVALVGPGLGVVWEDPLTLSFNEH